MAKIASQAGPALAGPAPGRLETVRAFINTLDIEAGTDALSTPAGLLAWLRDHDLLAPPSGARALRRSAADRAAAVDAAAVEAGGVEAAEAGPVGAGPVEAAAGSAGAVTAADLRQAVALREALRWVLRSHVGTGPQAGRAAGSQTEPAIGKAPRPVADLREIAGELRTRLAITDDGQVEAAPDGAGASAGLVRLLLIAAEASITGTWSRLKVCSADDCQWAFYDRSPTRNGCWCSMAVCGSRAKSRAYRQRAAARR